MYGLRNSKLSTCLFQFSYKMRQTMLLYAYFTPKVDFKRKFNHHQSFLYEWRLTARTIFGSDHQYESNLESDVRFEIESNHEASQVPRLEASNLCYFNTGSTACKTMRLNIQKYWDFVIIDTGQVGEWLVVQWRQSAKPDLLQQWARPVCNSWCEDVYARLVSTRSPDDNAPPSQISM